MKRPRSSFIYIFSGDTDLNKQANAQARRLWQFPSWRNNEEGSMGLGEGQGAEMGVQRGRSKRDPMSPRHRVDQDESVGGGDN